MNKQNTFKRTIGNKKGISAILVLGLLLFATCTIAVKAAPTSYVSSTTVNLGSATTFSVFSAASSITPTITNTGSTTITGDVGTSSTASSITGFGLVSHGTYATSSLVTGNVYAYDYASPTPSLLTTAAGDIQNVYTEASVLPYTKDLTATPNLGGQTLTPGVYYFESSAGLTGTLTLSGGPSDVWIFQIGSTLITASDSHVVIGDAQPCNVIWQVGSSATLGTNTDFNGTILAHTSITANTGATVDGRLLALNGAVTLDTNTINNQKGQLPLNVVPEYTLGALAALGASFAALLVYKRKSLPNLHLNTHI